MEKTFQYQSAEISYREIGEGKPVLLIHGFGEDSQVWNNQIDFLQKNCRMIIPDLPGSGKSKEGQPFLASSIDVMADAIFALMDVVTTERFLVLGHSMGGYIALAMAEKHPDRLTGFGLVHSTAFADNDDKKATRRKGIGFIQKNGAAAFLETATPGLFTESYKTEHPDKVEEMLELGKKSSAEALVAYYEAMIARPDRTSVLKSSFVPVLFIIGKQDKAVLPDDVLQQVHLPNVSYVHILENAAHMGMWEEKDAVNEYLLQFIKDASK